jgi:putative transposase
MLSEKRDEPAARAFFEKAIGYNGFPEKVTIDKSGANKAGIDLKDPLILIDKKLI